MQVSSHPEADAETAEAFAFYLERSERVAEKFLNELKFATEKILRNSQSHRFTYNDYLRVNLHRYPFHLIYRLRGHDAFIIAVAHDKRHPHYWKSRIED